MRNPSTLIVAAIVPLAVVAAAPVASIGSIAGQGLVEVRGGVAQENDGQYAARRTSPRRTPAKNIDRRTIRRNVTPTFRDRRRFPGTDDVLPGDDGRA